MTRRRAQAAVKRRAGRRRVLHSPASVCFSLGADVASIVKAAAGSGRVTALLRRAADEYSTRRPVVRFRRRVRGLSGHRAARNRRTSRDGPAWRFDVALEADTRNSIREIAARGRVTIREVLEDAVATYIVRRLRASDGATRFGETPVSG